jgi:hypothetical protein
MLHGACILNLNEKITFNACALRSQHRVHISVNVTRNGDKYICLLAYSAIKFREYSVESDRVNANFSEYIRKRPVTNLRQYTCICLR